MSACAAAACALLVTACGSVAAPRPGAPGASASDGAGAHLGDPVLAPSSPSAVPTGPAGSPCYLQPSACAGAGNSAAPWVSLDVTIYPADNAPPSYARLTCDPAGGTVPDPAAACAQILADPGLLEPPLVTRAMMCPMMLASGARAVVDGTYLGKLIAETIEDGGCDLQRWVELVQIFGG
jgi:hypothetical protein